MYRRDVIAGYLRWVDVDPRARAAIDLDRIAEIVRPLITTAAAARGPRFREQLVDTLQRELLIAFGPWIDGWRWSVSGGGPVTGWCCAEHSLFPHADDPTGGPRTDLADRDDDPIAASTARVLGAIASWQSVLDELATLFAQLRDDQPLPGPGGVQVQIERGVEIAAARVLAWTVEKTHAEDAWYATFTNMLGWYVESAGYDLGFARQAIEDAIDGKFESWSEPADAVATATCSELGRIIHALEHRDARDATAAWQNVRATAFQQVEAVPHVTVRDDGHRRYIEERDRARDPERADRMSAALELCRDSAKRGMALTFDQLCEWQAAVLGERVVGFRTGTAFAKRGREVYPSTPDTPAQFERALADANGNGDLAIRAARVYLDICCYHPFVDGNARAARLALDHVLTRAGYALHAAEPVFIVSRTVEDRLMGWSLSRVLDRLIGPIA